MFFEEIASEAKGCPTGPKKDAYPQLPGTVLRVFIPAGAVINLLNLIELTSPTGICLIVRLPFLGGKCEKTGALSSLLDSLKAAGAKIELAHE